MIQVNGTLKVRYSEYFNFTTLKNVKVKCLGFSVKNISAVHFNKEQDVVRLLTI